VDLDELIARVDEQVLGGEPLAQVAAARDVCFELTALGDQLVDHFVEAARREGCSWAQIGSVLGVSRQGAQQRYGGMLRRPRMLSKGRGIAGIARFGADARRAVVGAQDAARSMAHDHVGTEHLLVGILSAGPDATGATMLERAGVTAAEVEAEVVSAVGRGTEPTKGHIPFSPAAKKALELSLREAIAAGERRIGTEHLLLALTRDRTGVSAQLLARHGIERERVLTFVRESRGA
jgi:hypothetical protein